MIPRTSVFRLLIPWSFFALAMGWLASCSPRLDPQEIDDKIWAIQDSVFDYGRRWGEEFQIGFLTGDYSGLGPIREEMEAFLIRSHDRLEALEDRGGSEDYRKRYLEFLSFEKQVAGRELKAFESLDEDSPDSLAAHYYSNLTQVMEKEQEYLEAIDVLAGEFRERHSLPERGY